MAQHRVRAGRLTQPRVLVLPEGTVDAGRVVLPDEVGRHVRDVLRVRSGAPVIVTDGAGVVAEGTIEAVERRRVSVQLGPIRPHPRPPGPSVRLLQGVGKGDKLEAVVRQCVELGVSEIEPVWTERTIAHQRVRVERLRSIAEDAMRVAGRTWRPRIGTGRRLIELLDEPRADRAFALVVGAPRSLARGLCSDDGRSPTVAAVELVVGPEGGLTEDEAAAVGRSGFEPVHLGPYTLRTETAGPAAVAVVMALSGGWSTGEGSLRSP